ncbi:MAG TPA: sigma 54-interacting transcriptional regulator [Phycisphaerales bacterium]|nr:sigma 54-interacting transcriptional regulator [Phycisphaerales bacterium]
MSPVAASLHGRNAEPLPQTFHSPEHQSTHAFIAPGIPALAVRAAQSECPILITGETGVGKGYLANWIHHHSRRAASPMIAINCGAIPESIIDSHLFGHARGAFSGADREHVGLVRAADGGTLFLDEITDLPMATQSRLLRLLEEREVQPVGHARPMSVNVRIMTAANVDLWHAVTQGRFRKDLYFRLDVISIELLPLRKRTSEIGSLIDQFNEEFAELYQQDSLVFSQEAHIALRNHSWPGNIRELRSVIERLHVLVGPDVIVTSSHLDRHAQLRRTPVRSGSTGVLQLKSHAAREALRNHGGDVRAAAAMLGVHRATVYRWLAKTE